MRQYTIFFFLCLFFTSFNALALEYYRVTDEPINIRVGPGTNFKMLAQARKGEKVLFLKQDGDWVNISFLHPDGRKVQGWMHAAYLKPEAGTEEKLENVPVLAKALGAHLECLPNTNNVGVGSCMLNLDLSVSGPLDHDAAEIRCESELLLYLESGEVKPLQEVGRIRTPLKEGVGAARIQLMVFPVTTSTVEKVTVVDYHCIAQSN
ncbi:SH3 domain-containing protein [Neptunomonas antarctica]|uniref:SH3 domain-containing protein n=1 Tax=Neptunomonas antarctica TaxID=619304 RepID=A0A1N7KDS8_9GAMM|nr:SH3 domain-containing protein [Neptunomonas antarctica]SIS59767.1 SH3 domain-containing protein [Neptunomonas antarctica]